jgi:hypothetical protein
MANTRYLIIAAVFVVGLLATPRGEALMPPHVRSSTPKNGAQLDAKKKAARLVGERSRRAKP